jgi:iron(III) transport system permease protein
MRLDEAGFVSQAAAFSVCTMAVVVTALGLMKLSLWLIGRRQTIR